MLRFMRLHSVYSASFYTDYISVRAIFPLQKLHIHRLKLAVIRYAHYILNRMYCQCPQSAELSRQKGGKPIFPNCFGGRLPPFFGCRVQREPYSAFRLDTAHFRLFAHAVNPSFFRLSYPFRPPFGCYYPIFPPSRPRRFSPLRIFPQRPPRRSLPRLTFLPRSESAFPRYLYESCRVLSAATRVQPRIRSAAAFRVWWAEPSEPGFTFFSTRSEISSGGRFFQSRLSPQAAVGLLHSLPSY